MRNHFSFFSPDQTSATSLNTDSQTNNSSINEALSALGSNFNLQISGRFQEKGSQGIFSYRELWVSPAVEVHGAAVKAGTAVPSL